MRLGRLSLLASNPNPSPIELLDVIEDVVIQISATITIKQDSIVGHLRLVRIDGIDGMSSLLHAVKTLAPQNSRMPAINHFLFS